MEDDQLIRYALLLALVLGVLCCEGIYFYSRPFQDAIISHLTFGIINRYSKLEKYLSFHNKFSSLSENYNKIKYNTAHLNECPAIDVYKSIDKQGFYGYDTSTRVGRVKVDKNSGWKSFDKPANSVKSINSIKFRVGQVVKHKKFGYKGVIVAWDESCKATTMWRMAMHAADAERALNTPHYAVLVDVRNRPQEQQTYVAEWNLMNDFGEVKHSKVQDYFDRFEGRVNRYIMRPALKALYLED